MTNKKKDLKDEFDLDDKEIFEDDELEEKKGKKYTKETLLDDYDDEEEDYQELTAEERIESIEKKTNILIILVAIVLLFSVVNTITSFNKSDANTTKETQESNDYSYDVSAFKEITASDVSSESKSGTIIFWIGHQGCAYCQAFAPTMAKISKEYGVEVRYIDFAKIVDFTVSKPYIKDTTAWDTLEALTGSGSWSTFVKDNLSQTPLTIVVNKNKVIGGLVGNDTEEKIEQLFKDSGFSK
ncbi:MAG TPA: hypothetical protein DCE23_00575 [Firmicutes bacterium]|nr:hypothetical protein [Bacillota bacterium]